MDPADNVFEDVLTVTIMEETSNTRGSTQIQILEEKTMGQHPNSKKTLGMTLNTSHIKSTLKQMNTWTKYRQDEVTQVKQWKRLENKDRK